MCYSSYFSPSFIISADMNVLVRVCSHSVCAVFRVSVGIKWKLAVLRQIPRQSCQAPIVENRANRVYAFCAGQETVVDHTFLSSIDSTYVPKIKQM